MLLMAITINKLTVNLVWRPRRGFKSRDYGFPLHAIRLGKNIYKIL